VIVLLAITRLLAVELILDRASRSRAQPELTHLVAAAPTLELARPARAMELLVNAIPPAEEAILALAHNVPAHALLECTLPVPA